MCMHSVRARSSCRRRARIVSSPMCSQDVRAQVIPVARRGECGQGCSMRWKTLAKSKIGLPSSELKCGMKHAHQSHIIALPNPAFPRSAHCFLRLSVCTLRCGATSKSPPAPLSPPTNPIDEQQKNMAATFCLCFFLPKIRRARHSRACISAYPEPFFSILFANGWKFGAASCLPVRLPQKDGLCGEQTHGHYSSGTLCAHAPQLVQNAARSDRHHHGCSLGTCGVHVIAAARPPPAWMGAHREVVESAGGG